MAKTRMGTPKTIDVPESPWDELETLRVEWLKAREDQASTKRLLDQLHRELNGAHGADQRAIADALRSGKKTPSPDDFENVRQKVDATKRLLDAYTDVLHGISQDVVDLVESQRPGWLSEAENGAEGALEAVLDAIQTLRTSYTQLIRANHLRDWVRDFPGVKPFKRPQAVRVHIFGHTPFLTPQVIDGLTDAFTPEPERSKRKGSDDAEA